MIDNDEICMFESRTVTCVDTERLKNVLKIAQGLLCEQSGHFPHVSFSATRTLNITGPNKIACHCGKWEWIRNKMTDAQTCISTFQFYMQSCRNDAMWSYSGKNLLLLVQVAHLITFCRNIEQKHTHGNLDNFIGFSNHSLVCLNPSNPPKFSMCYSTWKS